MPVSPTRKKLRDGRYEAGRQDGRKEAFAEVLTVLEKEYVNSTNLKSSPEDQALLKLATRIGKLVRGEE